MEGYTSSAIIDELTSVLGYSRFGLTDREVEEARDYLLMILEIVEPQLRVAVIEEDPDDNRVLECALETHADYIVTGDKHLLKLREHGGVKTVSATELLEGLKTK